MTAATVLILRSRPKAGVSKDEDADDAPEH
jgi:hypothetical protein